MAADPGREGEEAWHNPGVLDLKVGQRYIAEV
jgi:hypothetical protein